MTAFTLIAASAFASFVAHKNTFYKGSEQMQKQVLKIRDQGSGNFSQKNLDQLYTSVFNATTPAPLQKMFVITAAPIAPINEQEIKTAPGVCKNNEIPIIKNSQIIKCKPK